MRKANERNWLNIAEYVLLASSLAGSVAAVASQQVVYATAPLTLAMSLNLASRQRLQQQSQQQIEAISDVRLEAKSLHNKVQALPLTERVNDVEASIRKLEQTIVDVGTRQQLDTLVEAFNSRPELKAIGSLNEAISYLRNRLEQLPPPTEPFDPLPLKLELEKSEQSITFLRERAAAAIALIHHELSGKIESRHTSVQSRLMSLEAIDHSMSAQAIVQLQADSQALEHNTALIKTRFQNQIDSLRQRLQAFPPPFDFSSLEQRLAALEQNNSTAEMEFERLSISIMQVQSGTASIESFIAQLKKHLDSLAQQFDARPEPQLIDDLRSALADLSRKEEPFDPSHLMAQIESLKERIDNLPLAVSQQQLAEVQELIEGLDASAADLQDRTQNLVQMQQELKSVQKLTCSLDKKTTQLENRTENLEQVQQQLGKVLQLMAGYVQPDNYESLIAKLSEEVAKQVNATVEQQVAGLNQLLQANQSKYEYKLVCDRNESRAFLLKAAREAQERLILVCPWLHYGIHSNYGELLEYFNVFLQKRNGCIDIGWGNRADLESGNFCCSSRSIREELKASSRMYSALGYLERLEKNYPKQFNLKLLGTHEKFLVCDRSWAMLGSHNFLTSGDKSQEREVGLWTNDPYIIDQLIKRFEDADSLEEQWGMVSLAS